MCEGGREEAWPEWNPDRLQLWFTTGLLESGSPAVDGLPVAERERAARFLAEAPRRRYLTARLLLRGVLARCLQCEPSTLNFEEGPWGKPVLSAPTPPGAPPLHFNLSRSHEVVLLGVSGHGELGVDVEFNDPARFDMQVAERQFAPEERDYCREASDPAQAFFDLWASKEAYIKALGRGLSHPLREFDVGVPHPDVPREVRDWSKARPAEPLRVLTIEAPDPAYRVAVAGTCGWEGIDVMVAPPEALAVAL